MTHEYHIVTQQTIDYSRIKFHTELLSHSELMDPHKSSYRPEIDGIRALAVLAVIFYHAGFQWISGGMFGVDVFFVISGYLITRILLSDIDNKKLSLKGFYYRRARRLVPAFLFVLLICSPLALWLLTPDHLAYFALAAISSLLFISNWFHASHVDYFSPHAEHMPLLHTWSLSVEEQFYIVFPLLLLILCHLLRRKQLLFAILGLLVASLIVGQWIWHDQPEATFNHTVARAWELLVGAGLAIWLSRKSVLPNSYATTCGLAMVLMSMLTYNSSMDAILPYSTLAVVGTALMIAFSGESDPITRLLKTKVLVLLGLISYSAYLWHQPIMAFTRTYTNSSLSLLHAIAAIAGTLALATFTWRFVESPFRRDDPVIKRPMAFISIAVGVSSIPFIIASYAAINNGHVNRYAVDMDIIKTMNRPERTSECFNIDNAHITANWKCTMGIHSDSTPSIFFFGDSHSESLIPAFDLVSNQLDISAEFAGAPACSPLLEVYPLQASLKNTKNCNALSKRVYEYIKSSNINTLVLASAWSQYTDGGYNGDRITYTGLGKDSARTQAESRNAFIHGVKSTIRAYENIGVNVLFVAQVPEQHAYPVKLYDSANRSDTLSLNDVSVSLEDHLNLQAFAKNVFNNEGYTLVDVSDTMCTNGRCLVGDEINSYYYDDNHLSTAGALRLSVPIRRAIEPYLESHVAVADQHIQLMY